MNETFENQVALECEGGSCRIDEDILIVERHLEWQFGLALRDPARFADFGDVVCVFTELLRTQEKPIERVLVRLKDAMRRAQATSSERVLGNGPRSVECLTSAAVLRCIEHYYRSPHSSGSSVNVNAQ